MFVHGVAMPSTLARVIGRFPPSTRTGRPAALAVAVLLLGALALAAGACARFARVESEQVDRLALRLGGGGDAICVNDPRAHIVVDLVYRDGKRVETWNGEGSRNDKVRLTDLAVSSDGNAVAIDEVGRIRFPRDRLSALDQRVTIRARLRERPIEGTLTLTPRFDCGGLADYSGAVGAAGGTGGGGGPGQAGPALRISLARIDTRLNGRLLLVRVTHANAAPEYYMVSTRGPAARFAVAAVGGDGGDGGQGERGADGSAGSDGQDGWNGDRCKHGRNGRDARNGHNGGNGGEGGDGGDGGNGGEIVVEYAPGSAVLARQLAFRVGGGAAGAGGRGGDGGDGGAGGKGGEGGRAGSNKSAEGQPCLTAAGVRGRDGLDGTSGSTGSSGSDGRPGARGSVHARAVDTAALWDAEMTAGAAIVLDPLEH